MKKIFILFTLFTATLLSSCSDDDEKSLVPDTIEISADKFHADSEGAKTEVVVTSSGNWRVTNNYSWVHTSADSGQNGDKITVTIDPNSSGEELKGILKFFTGTATASLKVSSEADGSGGGGDDDDGAWKIVSSKKLSLLSNVQYIEVKIDGTVGKDDLSISYSDEQTWISEALRKESVNGNIVISLKVEENVAGEPRECTVTFTDGELSKEVLVVQEKKKYIKLSTEDETVFGLEGGSLTVDVDASVPYEFESDSWIVAEKSTDTPDRFVFKIQESETTRSGKIRFYCPESVLYDVVLDINQINKNLPEVTIVDDNFRTWLVEQEYISQDGDKYLLTEKGLSATEIYHDGAKNKKQIKSVEGIEVFENLERITIEAASVYSSVQNHLTKFDISKLKKVASLSIDFNPLEEIMLGDNPVTELAFENLCYKDTYKFPSPESVKVSGTKLKTFNIPLTSYGYDFEVQNRLTVIDISGCSNLEKMNCKRSESGVSILKKIKVTQAQKDRIAAGQLLITLNEKLEDILEVVP